MHHRHPEPFPEHVPCPRQAPSVGVIGDGISVLQLNIEGLTGAKVSVLERVIGEHKPSVVLLQETHVKDISRLKIPGYSLAASTRSDTHGIATFVQHQLKWHELGSSDDDSSLEWAATEVEGVTIANVYKPPPYRLKPDEIPLFTKPCIYAGDFNCRSTTWGYCSTNLDGTSLEDWASAGDLHLLYDPKQPGSFHSGRWNTATNPDLAFVNLEGPEPQRFVLEPFPKSQHRPSLIKPNSQISPIRSNPVKRWNFRKANWTKFRSLIEEGLPNLPSSSSSDLDQAYTASCQLLISAAKSSIPRGFRPQYVPTWDEECTSLYKDFLEAEPGEDDASDKASALTDCLNKKRRKRWEETVQGIDFTHSSRLAWKTLNRLTGRGPKPSRCPVTANSIAKQLLGNGKYNEASKTHALDVKRETSSLWHAPGVDSHLSEPFTTEEIIKAVNQLKSGKAQGPDNIPPEFLINCGQKCTDWLRVFFSTCLARQAVPKVWRKATIIAIPKPNKPAEDPKNYRPISLLCVPFKLLERLILSRLEPVVDPQLPPEQAGFRKGRSNVHQILQLTDDIEEAYEVGHKAGVLLVDLTAAYDTVWHQGLILKLLRMVPDRHLVRFIATIISNRSFILKTSDGQASRPRRLKNGVPQGSVLAPTLFNIYISDLPKTKSHQYGYADDLALLNSDVAWSRVEEALSQDITTIADYLKLWRLKLSMAKTTATAFHLSTKHANRQLTVLLGDSILPYSASPIYLGVKLDRQLTYRQHLESLRAKTSSRVNLLRRLAGTSWGSSASTLRTSTLALVFSAAEYASPVWSRSTHTKKLDPALNGAMRLITGCLRPTPVKLLPVLSGIAPPTLRREHHTHTLVMKALRNGDHILHDRIKAAEDLGCKRLSSRRPFCRHAASPECVHFNLAEEWKQSYQESTRPPQFTVTPSMKLPSGSHLPRSDGVTQPLVHWSWAIQRQHAPMGLEPLTGLHM